MLNYLIKRIPIFIGAGIGALIGLLFDKLEIFLAIGAGVGLLFTIILGLLPQRTKK